MLSLRQKPGSEVITSKRCQNDDIHTREKHLQRVEEKLPSKVKNACGSPATSTTEPPPGDSVLML